MLSIVEFITNRSCETGAENAPAPQLNRYALEMPVQRNSCIHGNILGDIKMDISKVSVIALIITLSGCASTEIASYGKDSYLATSGDWWGMTSPNSLRMKTAREANLYCAKLGKKMIVRRTESQGVTGWTSTSSDLVFSCVSESDPEYQRPNLKSDPNVIIENRN